MAESDGPELQSPQPVFWVASSKKDLKMFPRGVRRTVGQALFDAQNGGKHPDARPLKGFTSSTGPGFSKWSRTTMGRRTGPFTRSSSGVLCVQHAFQKKSKSGIKTPPQEIEKVKSRLREAEKDYADWTEQQKRKDQDDH